MEPLFIKFQGRLYAHKFQPFAPSNAVRVDMAAWQRLLASQASVVGKPISSPNSYQPWFDDEGFYEGAGKLPVDQTPVKASGRKRRVPSYARRGRRVTKGPVTDAKLRSLNPKRFSDDPKEVLSMSSVGSNAERGAPVRDPLEVLAESRYVSPDDWDPDSVPGWWARAARGLNAEDKDTREAAKLIFNDPTVRRITAGSKPLQQNITAIGTLFPRSFDTLSGDAISSMRAQIELETEAIENRLNPIATEMTQLITHNAEIDLHLEFESSRIISGELRRDRHLASRRLIELGSQKDNTKQLLANMLSMESKLTGVRVEGEVPDTVRLLEERMTRLEQADPELKSMLERVRQEKRSRLNSVSFDRKYFSLVGSMAREDGLAQVTRGAQMGSLIDVQDIVRYKYVTDKEGITRKVPDVDGSELGVRIKPHGLSPSGIIDTAITTIEEPGTMQTIDRALPELSSFYSRKGISIPSVDRIASLIQTRTTERFMANDISLAREGGGVYDVGAHVIEESREMARRLFIGGLYQTPKDTGIQMQILDESGELVDRGKAVSHREALRGVLKGEDDYSELVRRHLFSALAGTSDLEDLARSESGIVHSEIPGHFGPLAEELEIPTSKEELKARLIEDTRMEERVERANRNYAESILTDRPIGRDRPGVPDFDANPYQSDLLAGNASDDPFEELAAHIKAIADEHIRKMPRSPNGELSNKDWKLADSLERFTQRTMTARDRDMVIAGVTEREAIERLGEGKADAAAIGFINNILRPLRVTIDQETRRGIRASLGHKDVVTQDDPRASGVLDAIHDERAGRVARVHMGDIRKAALSETLAAGPSDLRSLAQNMMMGGREDAFSGSLPGATRVILQARENGSIITRTTEKGLSSRYKVEGAASVYTDKGDVIPDLLDVTFRPQGTREERLQAIAAMNIDADSARVLADSRDVITARMQWQAYPEADLYPLSPDDWPAYEKRLKAHIGKAYSAAGESLTGEEIADEVAKQMDLMHEAYADIHMPDVDSWTPLAVRQGLERQGAEPIGLTARQTKVVTARSNQQFWDWAEGNASAPMGLTSELEQGEVVNEKRIIQLKNKLREKAATGKSTTGGFRIVDQEPTIVDVRHIEVGRGMAGVGPVNTVTADRHAYTLGVLDKIHGSLEGYGLSGRKYKTREASLFDLEDGELALARRFRPEEALPTGGSRPARPMGAASEFMQMISEELQELGQDPEQIHRVNEAFTYGPTNIPAGVKEAVFSAEDELGAVPVMQNKLYGPTASGLQASLPGAPLSPDIQDLEDTIRARDGFDDIRFAVPRRKTTLGDIVSRGIVTQDGKLPMPEGSRSARELAQAAAQIIAGQMDRLQDPEVMKHLEPELQAAFKPRGAAKKAVAAPQIIKRVQKPVTRKAIAELFMDNNLVKGSAIAFAGFAAWGLYRNHKRKDRTIDDMTGPVNLPGGSAYQYAQQGVTNDSGAYTPSSANGQTYQVTASGSFDPQILGSQMQSVTGGQLNMNIHSRQNVVEQRQQRLQGIINGY